MARRGETIKKFFHASVAKIYGLADRGTKARFPAVARDYLLCNVQIVSHMLISNEFSEPFPEANWLKSEGETSLHSITLVSDT
jgi:hypothetical protein